MDVCPHEFSMALTAPSLPEIIASNRTVNDFLSETDAFHTNPLQWSYVSYRNIDQGVPNLSRSLFKSKKVIPVSFKGMNMSKGGYMITIE